jgi:ABC-type glycerol-3-phosphate transport system permease component
MEALHGPDRSPQHSASIPIVIIYVLFLDCYVSALAAGAVKG